MKRLLSAFLLCTASAAPAAAQAPALTGIFPPGGTAGSTVTATVSGSNLAEGQAVFVSGAGVKAELAPGGNASTLALKLTLEPKAEVGVREVRIVTKKGVSNAGRIWVGRYPDLLEKEPNDLRTQPQLVEKFPAALVGRADKPEDVDTYAFDVRAGETWVFAANAAAHLSPMDVFLTLLDDRGRQRAYATDTFGRDPRLIHTFKTGGRYLLQVRDTTFKGGPGHTYRISAGRLPVVTRHTPLGGQRGARVHLALHGVNLANLAPLPVDLPTNPGEDRLRVVPQTPLGPANPIDLFVGDHPETTETEPNDDPKTATRSGALPITVGGRIDRQGDRDLIAFEAKEKQVLLLDVEAKRIGSRLDPFLRVLDATGKELAANDDAVGKDSRLSFTAPATGTYYAELRSLSSRGGDDFSYRLRLSEPPAPDFSLAVTPDSFTIPAGASVAVTVSAQRSGYPGEIALRLENLPAGVTSSPVALGAGKNAAVFTLTAAPGTAPVTTLPRIVGTAKIGEKNVERIARGEESWLPPLATPQQAQKRPTELLVSAVGPEPPYNLTTTAPAMAVKQGQKLELTVKAARKPDFKDNIVVTVLGLPPNVTASALTINGNQTEGKVTLTAAGNAPVGGGSVIVQGTGKGIVVATPAQTLTVQPK